MISFDGAVAALIDAVAPLPTERIAIGIAAGRRLAEDVQASAAAPRTATSAMDGYAVVDCNTRPHEPYEVIGESRPGMPFSGVVGPGSAVRVFTGARLPKGADRVIVQEQALRDGKRVTFLPGYGPNRHIRAAGSDFAAGAVLLKAGTYLRPTAILAAAAADRAELLVHQRPRVAIIGTGDELAQPGTATARPDSIPDSVTFGD